MVRYFLFIGAIFGLLAVALGAFGAHALKTKISSDMLAVWHTAVQYHFYHTLALLAVALFIRQASNAWLTASGFAFIVGVVLFSGSLYWLALGGPKLLGPITPLGGLCFMVGWVLLAVGSLRSF